MRLADLNPVLRGSVDEGVLRFDCPVGGDHRIRVHIHDSAPREKIPSPPCCGEPHRYWQATGEFPDTLTLSPSINAQTTDDDTHHCWHGFIENGEVK